MRPNNTARAIAEGLIRSGRALPKAERLGSIIRLETVGSAFDFYWLSIDGKELRRGRMLREAEPLVPGFAARMAEIGRRPGPRGLPEKGPRRPKSLGNRYERSGLKGRHSAA